MNGYSLITLPNDKKGAWPDYSPNLEPEDKFVCFIVKFSLFFVGTND